MPTVTALVDHVKRNASLGSYDGTDEETLILAWLNDAYRYVCRECDTPVETVTASLVSGTSEYTLSDLSLTNIVRFKQLYVTGGSPDPSPLEAVDGNRMIELQSADGGATQDKPRYFALEGLDLLNFWPTPGSGLTLTGRAVVDPPVLVTSGPSAGEEATPSKIPAGYHYQVLANHAIAMGMDYRGTNPALAQYWRSERDRGISELRDNRNQMGGDMPPPIRVVRGRLSGGRNPDQVW